MQFNSSFSTGLIWAGVVLPAVLSLYFIFQFGIKTIFWDEWTLVPILNVFFTGENWIPNLLELHNEHVTRFPRLFVILFAYFTSFDFFIEIFVGWTLLSITLLVLWLLLRKTVPQGRWLIIPSAWITYSFSQYETLIWGYPSIQWYLTIFSVVSGIYFLNKIKYSSISIIPAVIFGIIGSFSHLIGLLFWFAGLISFRNLNQKFLLLLVYAIVGFSAFLLYFTNWNLSQRPDYLSSLNEPLQLGNYILVYLGNAIRLDPAKSVLDPIVAGSLVGVTILSLFIIMNLYYRRLKLQNNSLSSLTPWFQIATFSILAAFVTGIGRVDIGIEQAFANRYIPISNLFLEATLVFSAVVLLHLIKTNPKNRKFLQSLLVVLLALLCIYIAQGYIAGWVGATVLNERVSSGGTCLVNFESAPPECLEKIFPQVNVLKQRATILRDLCLGPFVTTCK